MTFSSPALADWSVTQKKDPITDATEVRAALKGDGGELVLMCSTDGTNPVFVFSPTGFLGGPVSRYEWRDFIYRFDDSPPVRTQWKYLDSLVVAPSEKATLSFVKQMILSDTLHVRAIRYDGGAIDASFDVKGTAEAFRDAGAICEP